MSKWTAADIPDQSGRTILITGANSGLGLASATALAARGARVLLACRSPERGASALDQVGRVATGERPELVALDLADLSSVRKASEEIRERTGDQLHVLMNNAGVMGPPLRRTTDGFESQIGTNHFGHAALTWLLMPAIRDRVVTVSSLAHRRGGLRVDDPNFELRRYDPVTGYGQSKLANLLFAFELNRRLAKSGSDVLSVAAHPGFTKSELSANMARSRGSRLIERGAELANRVISQDTATGALPQLYAATMPDVRGSEYFGPSSLLELFGSPARARASARARDQVLARRLWVVTAELTGVTPDPS
ncbi:oxidoreductase [Allokutzneria sp. A3M-2-11 16]|uniref:oxidoreductase n=1 Tax=Allokutzneria sp. A3M-2-11 16 TaxID=2962043 RepID=UPI0020B7F068|nr:oxidoreductase [Allokutzneria sp. A3M-2-11 16]MCP3801828.1 oxidoreductase [Allokutzneria sp. A3M-2-11 16]